MREWLGRVGWNGDDEMNDAMWCGTPYRTTWKPDAEDKARGVIEIVNMRIG